MISWTKFAQKGCFRSKTEKMNIIDWILHIWISSGTKFQLKLTSLIFFTKLAPKKNFRLKTENSHLWVRPWSLITILNTGADWHNGILLSLLLLVAETIIFWWFKTEAQFEFCQQLFMKLPELRWERITYDHFFIYIYM